MFPTIPDEILMKVIKLLSVTDLISCAKSCRRLKNIATDNDIWRYQLNQKWIDVANASNISYSEMFINLLLEPKLPAAIRKLIINGHLTFALWDAIDYHQITKDRQRNLVVAYNNNSEIILTEKEYKALHIKHLSVFESIISSKLLLIALLTKKISADILLATPGKILKRIFVTTIPNNDRLYLLDSHVELSVLLKFNLDTIDNMIRFHMR